MENTRERKYTREMSTKPRCPQYDREMPLSKYIAQKVRILQRDFFIKLSASELNTIQSLETEMAVDRYARKLILAKL